MIKQMKRRFMIVSMGAFSIVMLVLFILLNTMNYLQNVQREEQQAIEFVEIDLGISDKMKEPAFENEEFPRPKIENNTFNFEAFLGIDNNPGGRNFRQLLNYFYVLYDEKGAIESTSVGVGESVTEAQAQSLAMEIYSQDKSRGWSGYYRFIKQPLSDGRTVVMYVDAYRVVESILQFLLLSAGIFLILLLLVYVLLWYFSKKAIMPLVKNIERQKEFISNASHEIKTPLAVLSTNNDVMEMIGIQNEWTQSNRNQIKRLNALVEQMLLLARFDEGKASLQLSDINLSQLIKQEVSEISALLKEKGHQLMNQVPDEIFIHSDETSVRQLVTSLLENAVKYHVDSDPIEITWKSDTRELLIINSCETMTEDERKQLFDRFYRRDTARNREQGGSGMGLSIAQAVAQAAGIEIEAELESPTRIQFKLGFKK